MILLCSALSQLTVACSLLMKYCNVFRQLLLEHYLKLRSEAKPTISEQSDCVSSVESSCESMYWSFALEQCCHYSKQCRNNVATLCCAKNRRCESSLVTSPLVGQLTHKKITYNWQTPLLKKKSDMLRPPPPFLWALNLPAASPSSGLNPPKVMPCNHGNYKMISL